MYAKAKEQFDAGNKEFLRVKALLKEAKAERDAAVQVGPITTPTPLLLTTPLTRPSFHILALTHTIITLPHVYS